jgi:hypothetical protein
MNRVFCARAAGGAPGHVLFRSEHRLAYLSLRERYSDAPSRHLAGAYLWLALQGHSILDLAGR